MKERTINGKSFSQVIQELSEKFDQTTTDYIGNVALDIVDVEDRLSNVLGLNFSVETSSSSLENIFSDSYVLFNAIITIFDDEGNIVCKRTHVGGRRVSISTKTGKAVEFVNDYKTAFQSAVKKAAKSIGVGRYLSRKENRTLDTVIFTIAARPSTSKGNTFYNVSFVENQKNIPATLTLFKNDVANISNNKLEVLNALLPGDKIETKVIKTLKNNLLYFTLKDVLSYKRAEA